MTKTVNTTSSSEPELSGVDLARVALHQAREAAKARGEGDTRKAKRRTGTTVRRDGREPTGVAAVLQGLMADRAWDVPAAGGSILDQWPDIAATLSPTLAAHVQAVAFHAETGQLDLRPDSPAYATQLRLIGSRIVAAAHDAVGTQAVRTVRILAVGATAPAPREAVAAPTAAAGARGAGEDPRHGAARLPPRARRPPGRPARPARQLGRHQGDRAAEPGHARAQPPGIPRVRRRPGRCTGPDRAGPRAAPPPGRRLPRRRAAPGPN